MPTKILKDVKSICGESNQKTGTSKLTSIDLELIEPSHFTGT